ncbi:MAG: hypothetical protein ACOCZP_04170 [Candidatus Hadarchaeota archaeon]
MKDEVKENILISLNSAMIALFTALIVYVRDINIFRWDAFWIFGLGVTLAIAVYSALDLYRVIRQDSEE